MGGKIMPADNSIGKNVTIYGPVQFGFPSQEHLGKKRWPGVIIGDDCIIRSGSILYSDVVIGNLCQIGHNVMIREKTSVGNHTEIGTNTIIEGNVRIGHNVSIQSQSFIPMNTKIGSNVFLGPNVVMTNDRYPLKGVGGLVGAAIEDFASIGANVTLTPGITIGRAAVIAAGSVVTKDVPAGMLAVGNPARLRTLPEQMRPTSESALLYEQTGAKTRPLPMKLRNEA